MTHHSIVLKSVACCGIFFIPHKLSQKSTNMDLAFLKSQFAHIPEPEKSFAGQTIIVTGSNTGLGLEAARHFVRLNASKVILAVRTIKKGEDAKSSIEQTTGRTGVVEVWQLDMANYESVKQFAKRCEGLDRLDVVLENA